MPGFSIYWMMEWSMPIYEYFCNSCGAEKEHLQKISDVPIAVCPECGSSDYIKRISAAGFQLKGNGWYATDFRDKKSKRSENKTESKSSAQPSTATSETSTTSENKASSTAAID